VEPGDIITKGNVEKVEGLVPDSIKSLIGLGLQIRIVPHRKVDQPQPYRKDTDYFRGAQLASDGRSLANYVAGLPFPEIDDNDPQIALKIMWNYEYGPFVMNDSVAINVDFDTGTIGDGKPMQVERHFLFDQWATIRFAGRYRNFDNPDKWASKWKLSSWIEPFDLRGGGVIAIRHLDPDRQDDTWLLFPSLRHPRRISSAQRSDALFSQDVDFDSFRGFSGQVTLFDWKYLGEAEVLASFHAESFPVKYCDGEGDFIFCDGWEPRKVYVVEGTPKQPQHAYGKRRLYIDQETYLVAYTELYDRSNQLWKVGVNQWSFRNRATLSCGKQYEDEMPFNPSFTMVDIQLNHATRVAMPGGAYPAQEGWVFNQDADPGLFTVACLQRGDCPHLESGQGCIAGTRPRPTPAPRPSDQSRAPLISAILVGLAILTLALFVNWYSLLARLAHYPGLPLPRGLMAAVSVVSFPLLLFFAFFSISTWVEPLGARASIPTLVLALAVVASAARIVWRGLRRVQRFRAQVAEVHTQIVEAMNITAETRTHDVRNMIAAALSELPQLQNNPLVAPGSEELLDRVLGALRRVKEILAKSRDPENDKEDRPRLIRMDHLLREIVERNPRDVHGLDIAIAEGIPTIEGGPDGLRFVFETLLDNAIKHTIGRPDARVEVGFDYVGDDYVTIWVRDNGDGIPYAYQPRIFTDRPDVPNRKPGGSGVGLKLAREIVKEHGGDIEFESEPDHGTTFRVTLPLRRTEEQNAH
jgi:signal transduction histidine kinase